MPHQRYRITIVGFGGLKGSQETQRVYMGISRDGNANGLSLVDAAWTKCALLWLNELRWTIVAREENEVQ